MGKLLMVDTNYGKDFILFWFIIFSSCQTWSFNSSTIGSNDEL